MDHPYLLRNGLPVGTGFSAVGCRAYSLCGVWRFRDDPEDLGVTEGWAFPPAAEPSPNWREVTVPGSWNSTFADLAEYRGPGWHSAVFSLPDDVASGLGHGHEVRIRFEAVALTADVWLNGRHLGGHEGGYTPFEVDATEAIHSGWNNLIVRADNRPHSGDGPAFPYGGITRAVALLCSDAARPFRLAVRTEPAGGGAWDVEVVTGIWSRTPARLPVKGRVIDPWGRVVASWQRPPVEVDRRRPTHTSETLRVEDPAIWDPATPRHRYQVQVAVGSEWVADEFGFRTVSTGDANLMVNGHPLVLRGVERPEDHPVHGPVQAADVVARDLDLLQRLGVTHVRPGHHPPEQSWLRTLAFAGITVSPQLPVSLGFRPMRRRSTLAAARAQLIEMIERDRNEPAVLLWSLGTGGPAWLPSARGFFAALAETARRYDDTRPLTAASSAVPVASEVLGLDFTAGAADVVSVDHAYGWAYRRTADADRLLRTLHRRHPAKPVMVGGFGGEAFPGRIRAALPGDGASRRRTWTEDDQAWRLDQLGAAALAHPWVCGVVPAALADSRSPDSGRGRSRAWSHPAPGWRLDGVTSAERVPKAGFDALKHLFHREDLDL